MSISKRMALKLFDRRYRSPELEIHEICETGEEAIYPRKPNAWIIRFTLDDAPVIRSSRLVCIAKRDGEVVYDGSDTDEG